MIEGIARRLERHFKETIKEEEEEEEEDPFIGKRKTVGRTNRNVW